MEKDSKVSYTTPAYICVTDNYLKELDREKLEEFAFDKIIQDLEKDKKKYEELFKKYYPMGKEDFEKGLDEISQTTGMNHLMDYISEDGLIEMAKEQYRISNFPRPAELTNLKFAIYLCMYLNVFRKLARLSNQNQNFEINGDNDEEKI